MSQSKDSTSRTLTVAFLLCIVCSVLVAVASVKFRPYQKANKKRDIQKNILITAGIYDPALNVEEQFKAIETHYIDLDTGDYISDRDFSDYDAVQAAKSNDEGQVIKSQYDTADIKRRANVMPVYLLKEEDFLKTIILPVHGKGLWGTMYGFLSIGSDLNTVEGISFYSHKETPGLGGEIDNPRWKAQWPGKKIYDENQNVALNVIKGLVVPGPEEDFQVDGLAGATITSRGVSGLVEYWLGEQGYGKFLKTLKPATSTEEEIEG